MHWHSLKRRAALNVKNLEASLQSSYNFRFSYQENIGISLGTRLMTARAKVYETFSKVFE